jgi:hypothetical protein
MINNFNQIQKLLKFDSEDEFYHLQILKRRKEHPELGSHSRVIKTYYISSEKYLVDKTPEIITLCNHHIARACINLNRRSFEKIAFQTLRKISDQIMNKDYKSVKKAYESVCGANSKEPNKKWIIDIDDKTFDSKELLSILYYLSPNGEKFIDQIETKNGYHLITKPFDIGGLRKEIVFNKLNWNFDIQKDNPTILYMP